MNASIQVRVQGYLTSQNYKEGGEVKTGDLLFQIDPRPFEAALAQAKAALAQVEAAARQAGMIAARNVALFQQKTISEQERDNAVQQAEAARANVEAQRAAVAQARLNVDYTAIRSPVNGMPLGEGASRRPGWPKHGRAHDRLHGQPDQGALHGERSALRRLHPPLGG